MSIAKNISFAALIALFACLPGCTKKDGGGDTNKEVNISIWGNYLSPEMAKRFTQETGIKINISNYTSNEELLAKIQAGASNIDIAIPSDYMVSIMSKLGLLHELDKTKIPNSAQLDPSLMKQDFDPENKFSVPYCWSTAGIAVNRDLYKGKITGWKDVFNNKELTGKISLLDDVREVTAAALKFNGASVNTTSTAELKKAEDVLLKMKPRVKMFSSDTVDALVKKEVAVAHSYSTDALQAAAQNSKIEYILPEEGGTKAIDNIVILKSAKNLEAAHKLVNFMLSTDNNIDFVKTVWGGPVLTSTKAQLPENIKSNTALFPQSSVVSRFEAIRDLGENTRLYDELWTRVKVE